MDDQLTSELDRYKEDFRNNRSTARNLFSTLTPQEFNWSPKKDCWSIAQCLTHLIISSKLYSSAILNAVSTADPARKGDPGPYQYGLFSRMMIKALDPTNRRTYKAPRKFAPPFIHYPVDSVIADFESSGGRWEECLKFSTGLNLAKVKVTSPVMPLLRFQLGATFAMMVMHERRHLLQAQTVTTTAGFSDIPLEDS